MPEVEQIALERLSLKQLFGMLSVGQVRAVIGVASTLIAGIFVLGMGVNEIRLAAKLDGMITKIEHQGKISSLEQKLEQEYYKQLQQQETNFDPVRKENKLFTLQIEFLEHSHAYLNARIKGKEGELNGDWVDEVKDSRTLFALTLKRMYKDGDRTLQKAEGY